MSAPGLGIEDVHLVVEATGKPQLLPSALTPPMSGLPPPGTGHFERGRVAHGDGVGRVIRDVDVQDGFVGGGAEHARRRAAVDVRGVRIGRLIAIVVMGGGGGRALGRPRSRSNGPDLM